jgi:hypothetical protein
MIRLGRDGIWRSDLYDAPHCSPAEGTRPDVPSWVEEQEILRKRWKAFQWEEQGPFFFAYDVRTWSARETALAGCERLRCGAKNRIGEWCGKFHLHPNGRCRFHGGLSTGPKTPEGRKKVAKNLPNPMVGVNPQPSD